MKFVLTIPAGPSFEPRMAQTLRSLAAQNVRLTVALCDVSNDPAAHRLAEHHQPIIGYRRHGPDRGQSDAINEGWRALEGDVYGWLNCDDTLAPGALQRVANIFDSSDDIDIVYGQSLILDDAGALIGAHPAVRAPSDRLYYDDIISQPSCFVRRKKLFDLGLVREDLHYTMDWDLWIRLMEAGARFHYLPEVLSSVIWATDTKTGQLSWRRYKELWQVLSRNCSFSRCVKSMIGFTQHHFSAYGDNGVSSASWDFFKANGTIRLPLFHYQDRAVSAISLHGLEEEPEVVLNGKSQGKGSGPRLVLSTPIESGSVATLEIHTAGTPELHVELITD